MVLPQAGRDLESWLCAGTRRALCFIQIYRTNTVASGFHRTAAGFLDGRFGVSSAHLPISKASRCARNERGTGSFFSQIKHDAPSLTGSDSQANLSVYYNWQLSIPIDQFASRPASVSDCKRVFFSGYVINVKYSVFSGQ